MNSQSLPIEGKVSSLDDLDVEGINILNLSTEHGAVTDANGGFQIAVSLGDTLSISAVHIQDTTVVVRDEQITDRKITINLSEKMNELATVTLRRALWGYIGTDVNIIPIQEPITAASIGLPNADVKTLSKTERQLYAANSGPVDALINMISGRTKMLKKRLELAKTYELTESLLAKFPETYFTDVLKIGKFKVYSFIYFCEDDPDYQKVMKENTMAIMEFLERKSEEYREE